MITIYSQVTGLALFRVQTEADAWRVVSRCAGLFYYL